MVKNVKFGVSNCKKRVTILCLTFIRENKNGLTKRSEGNFRDRQAGGKLSASGIYKSTAMVLPRVELHFITFRYETGFRLFFGYHE